MKEATELVASVSAENERLTAEFSSVSEKLSKFEEISASHAAIGAELVELQALFASDKEASAVKLQELSDKAIALEADKATLTEKVASLEGSAKTASVVALEILASTGGTPLEVDGAGDVTAPTKEELISASWKSANDPVELMRIYNALKEIK